MARIDKILERNEKKLDITQFISEECKEYDEEGKLKEDYVIDVVPVLVCLME